MIQAVFNGFMLPVIGAKAAVDALNTLLEEKVIPLKRAYKSGKAEQELCLVRVSLILTPEEAKQLVNNPLVVTGTAQHKMWEEQAAA